jgi:hypothetical protein
VAHHKDRRRALQIAHQVTVDGAPDTAEARASIPPARSAGDALGNHLVSLALPQPRVRSASGSRLLRDQEPTRWATTW